jgi:hypothetical protein
LAVEFVLGDLLDWPEQVDTRVVRQDIDFSECGPRFGEDAVHIRGFRDVSLHRDRFAAGPYDIAHDLVGAFAAARIIHYHGGPFARELSGDLGAYSLRCARHDCHLACQPAHRSAPTYANG